MLVLQKELASSNSESVSAVLQRQADALEKQIDVSVYELYGLTKEGIRIVEEGK